MLLVGGNAWIEFDLFGFLLTFMSIFWTHKHATWKLMPIRQNNYDPFNQSSSSQLKLKQAPRHDFFLSHSLHKDALLLWCIQ
jgi:hypothetical protein